MSASRDPGGASGTMVRRFVSALAATTALLGSTLVAAPAVAGSHAVTGELAVSVVVPITAPWGDGGLLDAATLETATSETGVLTHELDELLTTSATIALDPKIPASIRLLGTAAPASALDWLDRLQSAPNEVFLLAFADADLSALARSDSLDLARPLGLEFAIDPGAFGPAESPTPGPTDEPADAPPPLPTTDDLLAWPGTIGSIAWPAEGSLSAGDLAAYEAAAYDAVLASSANLSQAPTARVDLDGMPGLVADSAASALLREAAATIDAAARQDAAGRLGVTLDGLAAANPGRSVVLTLDRTPTFAIAGLAETLATLAARESVRIAGLSEVLSADAAPATVVESTPGSLVNMAPTLTAALRAEQAFATILTDPMPLVVPRQLALLKLLSVQNAGTEGWQAEADAFLLRSRDILGSVTIVDTLDVFITSGNTTMPVRVANALDFAVTVRVDARPQRPLLRIDSPAEVTVQPASSAIVNLGAQAVANGQVVVEVTISSPATGMQLGPAHRVNAELQAQWETVGIIVGIIVALVFAAGIVRNVVLRRRRARRSAESAGT